MTKDLPPFPLKAQTQWFHVFRAMIDQGDIARIGPHAFTVYAVIKAHANYHSGMASPSIERIAEQSGVSVAQVKRALVVLETDGLILITKSGRSNNYTLCEKIQITKADRPHTLATWAYVPKRAGDTIKELKLALDADEITCTKILNIERLNVQINLAEGNSQIDSQTVNIDWDRFPPSIRDMLRKNLKLE
jgi:DNA-binding transcriptional MocR family regulator